MTPGNLPPRNPLGAGGVLGFLRQTGKAVEGLTADVMSNRRPRRPGRILQSRIAVITDQGPEGNEGEPGRNNYWAKFQRMEYDEDADDVTFRDEERPTLSGIVKAKNIGEYFDSHGIRNDESEYVEVHKVQFNAAVPVIRWVFNLVPKPIWMKISASTQDSTNKRWKYTATEVEVSNAGYGNWSAVDSGIVLNSGIWDYAYNVIEDINSATGTYGNGTVSTDFSTTSYALKPVPNNVVLPMWIKWPEASTKPFMVFSTANGLAGGC